MDIAGMRDSVLTFFAVGFLVRTTLYMLFAGGLYLFLNRGLSGRLNAFRIQESPVPKETLVHEIKWSLSTILIFSFFTSISLVAILHGWGKMYFDVGQYGWGYFLVSMVLLLVIHDAWFYWTHRLLHLPWLFRNVHAIHHRAHNPSCFSALNFHPVEAMIVGAFVPLTIFLVPLHPAAFFIWFLAMLAANVEGHSGYEFRPESFARNALGRWFWTSVYHNRHHQSSKWNFGLYFFFWDRLMGTDGPDSVKDFEQKVQAMRARFRLPAAAPRPALRREWS